MLSFANVDGLVHSMYGSKHPKQTLARRWCTSAAVAWYCLTDSIRTRKKLLITSDAMAVKLWLNSLRRSKQSTFWSVATSSTIRRKTRRAKSLEFAISNNLGNKLGHNCGSKKRENCSDCNSKSKNRYVGPLKNCYKDLWNFTNLRPFTFCNFDDYPIIRTPD